MAAGSPWLRVLPAGEIALPQFGQLPHEDFRLLKAGDDVMQGSDDEAPPFALTDAHARALEKAIEAEGFRIMVDPETGDVNGGAGRRDRKRHGVVWSIAA